MIYQMTKSIFFCDTFNNVDNILTTKWLKKFEHEMFEYKKNEIISIFIYFETMNMLFIDDAIDWSKNHSNVIKFLTKIIFIQFIVDTFKSLLCERFFNKNVEI